MIQIPRFLELTSYNFEFNSLVSVHAEKSSAFFMTRFEI